MAEAELQELKELEEWNRAQQRERRRRLQMLRDAKVQSESSGEGEAANSLDFTGLRSPIGSVTGMEAAFQTRSALSLPTVTRRLPSGLKSTEVMTPLCALSFWRSGDERS